MNRTSDDRKFVKDARNRLNLTQEDLGQEIGVTRHTIRRYENGYSAVTPRSRIAIERLLQIKRK